MTSQPRCRKCGQPQDCWARAWEAGWRDACAALHDLAGRHPPHIREAVQRLAHRVHLSVGSRGYVGPVSMPLLDFAEQTRLAALGSLNPTAQDNLGQFFTPVRAAELIASMPSLPNRGALRVLDPGAGSGMLSAALVSRVLRERPGLSVHLVAVECDDAVLPYLSKTLDACQVTGGEGVTYEIVKSDYIMASTRLDMDPRLTDFDIVIQNPPYAKLSASSPHRSALRRAAVDAPNLYAAFLALGARGLRPGGQLVAITPRSFFNGPYFRAFRSYLLDVIALDRIHVFESRATVFADTGVLQENVILSGTRDGERAVVTLSVSSGHEDEATSREVPYVDVIRPDDRHCFIRLATNEEDTATADAMLALPSSLSDLGIEVSTGRVVDFRSRAALLTESAPGACPLVYPGNLRNGRIAWPRQIRKAQWFAPADSRDATLVLPEGWYCVVKRFSAKEERRRVVASVWSPERVPGPVAFENHLNVFHVGGAGLDEASARGLAMWLNSTFVDRFFRTFSGHTQVNATDLRTFRFPKHKGLQGLGRMESEALSQARIDDLVAGLLVESQAAA